MKNDKLSAAELADMVDDAAYRESVALGFMMAHWSLDFGYRDTTPGWRLYRLALRLGQEVDDLNRALECREYFGRCEAA